MLDTKSFMDLDYGCGDPDLDSFDIISAAMNGRNNMANDRHKNRTVGTVRGGSVGALVDGQFYGVCPRMAWLRKAGIEPPLEAQIELMTSAGEENETIWLRDLRASDLAQKYDIVDQQSFGCKWTTSDGTVGTGSPDVIIMADKETKKPIRGLELKLCSSVSTAIKCHYELRPNDTHIIQAANYAIRLGDQYNNGTPLPYQLVYSSRVMWHFYNMSQKNKNAILKAGHDINWVFGRPMSVKPFHRVYHLKWQPDATVAYWTPGMKQWQLTNITREAIDNYYYVVSSGIDEESRFGPKPTTKHIDGKASYSPCNFCPLNDICSSQTDIAPSELRDHAIRIFEEMWKDRQNKPQP